MPRPSNADARLDNATGCPSAVSDEYARPNLRAGSYRLDIASCGTYLPFNSCRVTPHWVTPQRGSWHRTIGTRWRPCFRLYYTDGWVLSERTYSVED